LAPETAVFPPVTLEVDDGETIGGIWSQERIYPSLYAQISYPLLEYSFYPMKNEGISPDGFISGQVIHNYLASFAEDHDALHSSSDSRVSSASKCQSPRLDSGSIQLIPLVRIHGEFEKFLQH
jgi:hypothetical protein